MKLKSPYRVKPHADLRLSRIPSNETGSYTAENQSNADLQRHLKRLDTQQALLAACMNKAVLIVLQGMDTGGKDGTIRHIFSGVNPQGCTVAPFKVPTPLEARHDFLWRVHRAVPPRGVIGIFNRSHYEDVLVVRVHKQISDKEAHRRMRQIVDWEEMLAENGVIILKFFLHISQAEQTRRLAARLDDPNKQWKISESDFAERKLWPDYQRAYEDVLNRTSRKYAPWFVIPSDHKWYRNVAISSVIADALESLDMKYPKPTVDIKKLKLN